MGLQQPTNFESFLRLVVSGEMTTLTIVCVYSLVSCAAVTPPARAKSSHDEYVPRPIFCLSKFSNQIIL
jgi:hypothetical protein